MIMDLFESLGSLGNLFLVISAITVLLRITQIILESKGNNLSFWRVIAYIVADVVFLFLLYLLLNFLA